MLRVEVKEENIYPFIVERTDDVTVLSDFYCGVNQMDNFIHSKDGLKLYVDARLTNMWIVRLAKSIVGFFALSKSSLILNSDDIRNVASSGSSSLKAMFEEVESFPALKLDYIAINREFKKRGIGSHLIGQIIDKALQDTFSSTLFLIVDAFDTPTYSSVGFYKKNYFKESEYGLIKSLNKRREGISLDTKLMYLPLFK